MNLTNQSYVIWLSTKSFTERYSRDREGWLKVSARGRKFRMTAEQVLNHLLPALAGIKPGLTVAVEHHPRRDSPARSRMSLRSAGRRRPMRRPGTRTAGADGVAPGVGHKWRRKIQNGH